MPADLIIVIPTSLYRGTWLEELEYELLVRGILSRVKERSGWVGDINKDFIYDIIVWRCGGDGDSKCPAIAFEGENAYLLVLDEKEDKYVKVLNFEDVMVEEIKGVIGYSDCIAKYGYDYC
jgi:hypothetical protein